MRKPKHPTPPSAELPGIDPSVLGAVTGGAGDSSSMMLPMMMMMRSRSAAAPPPPPPPTTPKILVNGVEQPASALTNTSAGKSFTTTV